MRHILVCIISVFIFNIVQAQIRLSDKDFKSSLPVAEKYLIEIFDKGNFIKSVKADFDLSREVVEVDHDKKYKSSGQTHFAKYSDLFFWVIQDKDTVGSFNVLVDSNARIVNRNLNIDLADPNSPILIVGYKKLLASEFKLNFKQVLESGRKHKFKMAPIFQAYINNNNLIKENKVFVEVKYVWFFSEVDESGGYNQLYLNAQTGKMEKEDYIKRMPQ